MDISVIVPLYNEEESLPELTAWIERVMQANGFSYEVWLVDDGSRDGCLLGTSPSPRDVEESRIPSSA